MLDAKKALSPHCEHNISLQFTFSLQTSIQPANRLHCRFFFVLFFFRVLSDMNLRTISPTFGDLLDLKTL